MTTMVMDPGESAPAFYRPAVLLINCPKAVNTLRPTFGPSVASGTSVERIEVEILSVLFLEEPLANITPGALVWLLRQFKFTLEDLERNLQDRQWKTNAVKDLLHRELQRKNVRASDIKAVLVGKVTVDIRGKVLQRALQPYICAEIFQVPDDQNQPINRIWHQQFPGNRNFCRNCGTSMDRTGNDLRCSGCGSFLRGTGGAALPDAPNCLNCGTKMRPAGSCFVCEGCGSTSGIG